MFHTLDKEELNLSIGPMALSVAEVGDFTRDYGTYIGDIKVARDMESWTHVFWSRKPKMDKLFMYVPSCLPVCYINSDHE